MGEEIRCDTLVIPPDAERAFVHPERKSQVLTAGRGMVVFHSRLMPKGDPGMAVSRNYQALMVSQVKAVFHKPQALTADLGIASCCNRLVLMGDLEKCVCRNYLVRMVDLEMVACHNSLILAVDQEIFVYHRLHRGDPVRNLPVQTQGTDQPFHAPGPDRVGSRFHRLVEGLLAFLCPYLQLQVPWPFPSHYH